MPSLPLDSVAVVAGAGDLPVNSAADVLALLPPAFKPDGSSPVRDALVAGLTQILEKWQERSGYAASQSDILRAVDRYLDGLANDHGFIRAGNIETDGLLRDRVLAVPELVSRQAILDVINPILARYSAIQARLFEVIPDRLFITNSDAPCAWRSYLEAEPDYPDRFYPEAAASNGGLFRAQSEPGRAWIFDKVGRGFMARLPEIHTPQSLHWFAFGPSHNFAGEGIRTFVANGTDASGSESRNTGTVAAFIASELLTSEQVYQSIVNAVDRVRGQGIRWELFTDALLTA